MFDIYLPIAQMSISLQSLVAIGLLSGLLSGLYGIGGGIIAVPIMIFSGIPTNIAIATSLLQIMAISSVNVLRNAGSGNIKFGIGLKLGIFSVLGSYCGTKIFILMSANEYFHTAIYAMYMIFVGYIGIFTSFDGFISLFVGGIKREEQRTSRSIKHGDKKFYSSVAEFETFISNFGITPKVSSQYSARKKYWIQNWSKIMICGFSIGILSGLMGIGGGFIAMPAIMYLFGRTIAVASMTSALVALISTTPACIMQFSSTGFIDPFIAIFSCVFAAFGVRIGNGLAKVIPTSFLKLGFGILLIAIATQFGFKLLSIGQHPYIISVLS